MPGLVSSFSTGTRDGPSPAWKCTCLELLLGNEPETGLFSKTAMESRYCGGQAAAVLREQTWFPSFPFSLLGYFQNCSLIGCLGKPQSILSSL